MDNNYKGVYISYTENDSDFDKNKRILNMKTLLNCLAKYCVNVDRANKVSKVIDFMQDENFLEFLREAKGLVFDWDKIEEDLVNNSYVDFCEKFAKDYEAIKKISDAKKNKFVQ